MMIIPDDYNKVIGIFQNFKTFGKFTSSYKYQKFLFKSQQFLSYMVLSRAFQS
jgi:hypothetical protein